MNAFSFTVIAKMLTLILHVVGHRNRLWLILGNDSSTAWAFINENHFSSIRSGASLNIGSGSD